MESERKDGRVNAEEAMLLGEGRGFEIAQGRLGPGRIHHCMRTIGVAEEAIAKMAKRLQSRVAFGRKVAEYSIWEHRLAPARIDIEMTRLLCLKAPDMLDKVGHHTAAAELAMLNVQAPSGAANVLSCVYQPHSGAAVSTTIGVGK